MAVEFVGIAEFKTDGGTSILMTAPVGTSVGDLLIAYISKDDNTAILETGSYGDWNMLFNNIANGQTCLYIAWKWAVAGDANQTTEYTWNGDSEDWLGEIICYKGVKAVTPIHGTPGIATGTSATPTAPSVAFENLAVGSLVLQVMGIDSDDDDYITPAQLTERFNAIQANDIGGAGGDKTTYLKWISPTGFNDPEEVWEDEWAVYDENTITNARSDIPPNSWSEYLELTINAIACSKVRFWATYTATTINQISVDVYYAGDWHNIYEGIFPRNEWAEKAIGSTQTVTAMRVKFYNDDDALSKTAAIFEVDFGNIESLEGTGEIDTAVFTATSRDWAAATLVIEAAVAAGEFEYTGTGSFIYLGTATQTHSKDYFITASGQFAYLGSAVQVYSKNYLFEGSGSLAFSGSAVIIFGLAFVGSGSLDYSGEAVVTYTRDYLSTAVGELVYSGEAIFTYLCNFLFKGSGELAYSGSATQSYTYNFSYLADGSLTFSGEAIYSVGFSQIGSGSCIFSGTATQVHTKDFNTTGTGSFDYSGAGSYALGFSYVSSGSFTYSGAAICEYTIAGADFEYAGSGSLAFSGTATQVHTKSFLYTGSGDFTYSGSATKIHTKNFLYSASGQLLYSGTALYSPGFSYIGEGTFVYSGTAIQVYSHNYLYAGSGEFIYSGIAECIYETEAVFYVYVGSGFFTFLGKAIQLLIYNFLYAVSEIYANESILSAYENQSILSISSFNYKATLSIYGNESVLSIEE